MKTVFIFLTAALLTTGCAGTPQDRSRVVLGELCGSLGTLMEKEAAPRIADGRFTDRQVDTVVSIRDFTKPYCAPGSDFDPAKAVTFVQSSLAQIQTIIGGN